MQKMMQGAPRFLNLCPVMEKLSAMGLNARKRHQRQSDFMRRKKSDPMNVHTVPTRGWEYIAVHPLADESILLHSLEMTPDDCTSVDCYWSTQDDVVFLKVLSKTTAMVRPGLYASKPRSYLDMTYLLAVVDSHNIVRSTLEAVMDHY